MKIKAKNPPRVYEVGLRKEIQIKDCGQIELEPDEQVTFVTERGAEYDVARKSWGFYATPSVNGRLKKFGLRTLIVKNEGGKFYVFLVEKGCEKKLNDYLTTEKQKIVCWLDDHNTCARLEQLI